MSDTGFDGQGITPGTGLILSLPAPLRSASLFHPDPQGRPARPGVFHRPDQQPHTRRAYLNFFASFKCLVLLDARK